MLFSADAWPGLADGTITVTFRTWTRPQAKVGGRYRVGGMLLQVDAVAQVRVARITARDARAAGAPTRTALLQRLSPREPLTPDRLVWRVDLHCVGEDDRRVLGRQAEIEVDELERLRTRLDRLDRAAPLGPWTRATLALIGSQPGVVSTVLADALDRERFGFKADVRKLKNLGLTESLLVGYRLTPRAETVLRSLGRSVGPGDDHPGGWSSGASSGSGSEPAFHSTIRQTEPGAG